MSLNAHRYAAKHADRIEVPKVPKLSPEQVQRLSLLERALMQEHTRHAARLAELRAVAERLQPLEPLVRAARERGALIDLECVRLSPMRYRSNDLARGVEAVVLRPEDSLSMWRDPREQNALAGVLLEAGWRIVFAYADGSTVSRDRLVFMRGRQVVETTCMREWVLDAIALGHITAETAGRHPAIDTGVPLRDPAAQGAAQPA